MAGRLFTLLSALSLVLCVATVAMWVRVYFASDWVALEGRDYSMDLVSSRGRLLVRRAWATRAGFFGEPQPPRHWSDSRPINGFIDIRQAGRVAYSRGFGLWVAPPFEDGRPVRVWEASVPWWFLGLLLAAPPAWCWRGWRRRRLCRHRALRGLCPQCGYDLRATPGRCPECGPAPKLTA